MNYPNFLIIGAMKCGTTSLHDYLNLHPDIFMTEPKEIHFFNTETYGKDKFSLYCKNFESSKKIKGTTPQNYTKRHRKDYSGIPGRIYNHLPKIKLIYLIRDPIERIISHYHEALEGGYAPTLGLNQSIRDEGINHHFVQTSMYYFQLEAYLEYFSKDQILIVESRELLHNRLETLNKIFSFLGVNNVTNGNLFDFKRNSVSNKRSKNIIGNWVYGQNSTLVRTMIPRKIKELIKENSIFKFLSRKTIEQEELSDSSRILLRELLKEDVEKLRKFTENSLKSWSI